ncbi:HAMP domain-containing histidine kinase [Mucilaginibacter sp. SMC90]|uniref:sensor histidine kinase n=1 Tax=Mucilaginibacter sp. SMC90 TaxID=2929803 RepID=UPI001FB2F3D8|nr:HAMP domain-containing sensor histidine kinase [Mucilaginibacter sp. SMC90]UOE50003.1 HAMP domain-containing histidine kinase [Mucilaginibacter sp. SMC90]
MAGFYIPYNLFAGLNVAALSCLIIGSIFFYQYYYSRYYDKKHNNIILGLTGLLIFSVNYFANSGINGSTDIIWPAYLLLIFAISPYKHHLTWLAIYILAFVILHIVEYYYPALVQYPFRAGKGQFTDRVTAFPLPVIAIYFIITFIKRSYDKEKAMVELKNKEITLQKGLLEQSNAEKSKLMSIISHDMRAPLINIQNYLELLNENELDNNQRLVLEKDLLSATNNTMQMLSNLLYWTKSQMERPTVNLQQVNLSLVLKSTLDMEKALAVKKGISLNYDIDDKIIVVADTDMLQLVVRNLVNNAIKFTQKGGNININAQVLAGSCKLTVSDNGKGIAIAEQENIFRITVDPTFGTNNEKGVGLGLMLCKEYIERQGGSIGFESIFGRGSSFFVFIAAKPL